MKDFTMKEYHRLAQRTSPDDGHDRMDNGMLGLIGETGEIVDVYKKYRYQSTPGCPLPEGHIMEELGDVLWYLAELSAGLGKEMINVMIDDFRTYDSRAGRPSIMSHKRDLRRNVLTMASLANGICESMERENFNHVETLMRRMLNAAANTAFICGNTLQDAAKANINKLRQRYPAGFDAEISMNRYT